MTSVVRSWRWGKDSVGPRSAVDIEKWDRTSCTKSEYVNGDEERTRAGDLARCD